MTNTTPPLGMEQALDTLLASVSVLPSVVSLPLDDALGYVLAEDILAVGDIPPWDVSMMDGYAVKVEDTVLQQSLPVSQRITAGGISLPLQPNTVARIFTGANIPDGANSVIMQEDCQIAEDSVKFNRLPKLGQHIRPRGEDVRKGERVLAAGNLLCPQHLGLLAAAGINQLPVHRKLKVAIFFTGDELVMPGHTLGAGQIYNSNYYVIRGLLTSMGCEVDDIGIVADNLTATIAALQQAANRADLIVTCGGVSVGEEDHVRAAVARLGQIDLWRVAIKPGKPFAFGRVAETPFLGLPGNPVSAFVIFCLFARPYILRSQGVTTCKPIAYPLPADFSWCNNGERQEWLRAGLINTSHGLVVRLSSNQGSAALTALAWADGLVEVPAGQSVTPGDIVHFLPFYGALS